MAATTPANLSRHYARILKQWPKDLLRPTSAFQAVIEQRAEAIKPNMGEAKQQAEMRKVNALYSLLDGRYAKKYPIPVDMLRPEANPNHYADLMKDLDEAPSRTQAESLWKKISGKVRMK